MSKNKRTYTDRYKHCGRELSSKQLSEIFRLRAQNPPATYTAIAKELNLNRSTVSKYCKQAVKDRKGLCLPQTPIDRQVSEVRNDLYELSKYNLQESFLKSLTLIDKVKTHLLGNAERGDMPAQTTPRMLLQLVQAEKSIVTLPQDLNEGRRDFYEQLESRLNEGCEESLDLGKSGDLQIEGEVEADE